jgi:hypothetical protein
MGAVLSVCGNVSTALVLLTSDAPGKNVPEHGGKNGDFMGIEWDFMMI